MKVLNIIHKTYGRRISNKNRAERDVKKYFKRAKTVFNLKNTYEFTFDDVYVDFPLEYDLIGRTNTGVKSFGADNVKRHLSEIEGINDYDIIVFYYSPEYSKIKNFRFGKDRIFPFTYYKKYNNKLAMVQIPKGDSRRSLRHELMHAIGKLKGVSRDYMDLTPVKIGSKVVWKKYYYNKEPYRVGGNYHKTFLLYERTIKKNLTVEETDNEKINTLLDLKYISNLPRYQVIHELKKHFKITELVPKVIATKHGESAWRVFDTNLLKNILFIRRDTGRAMTVNGRGMQYRGYDNSGYRPNTSISYHVLGKAIDFDLRGWNAGRSRQYIRNNYKRFPYPQGRIEVLKNGKEISWCHYDIGDEGLDTLLEFNV